MRRWWLGWSLLMVCAALAPPVWAQEIPPVLRAWQGWVLHDQPQHACPFLTGNTPSAQTRRCLWPDQLDISATSSAGHFQVAVAVNAVSWLALPGSDEHWPQQVSDNGQPVVVHDSNGVPNIRVQPGRHVLRGQWAWTDRPARLALPDLYGLLSLSVDGKSVSAIERGNNSLKLGASVAVQRAADALEIKVFRRLSDGLPARLETRLQIDVAGRARQQVLDSVLPQGFVATSLSAGLPARLATDGRLTLQLRPGHWLVTLAARGVKPLDDIALKLPPAPWPKTEVWSYADDAGLRQTRVDGQGIDAGQAGVPSAWRALPAFVLDDAHGLQVNAGARSGQGGKGDQLSIKRHMWLDFSGDGFMVRDDVYGTLVHPRRLSVAAPWQLLSASDHGHPLLVSKTEKAARGLELRAHNVNLTAGLRLPHSAGKHPVDGWQVPIERIDATLDLPHGYRLLGAPGVDRSPDSWVAQWTLLDLFLVALVALLCGRLLGWPMALLAGGYLALAHQQAFAPYLTLLLAVALALLARALPSGRLRSTTRVAAFAFSLLSLLWALPFAGTQLRAAVHPQLEFGVHGGMVEFIQPPAPYLATRGTAKRTFKTGRSQAGNVAIVTEETSAMAVQAPPPPPSPPPPSAPAAAPAAPVATQAAPASPTQADQGLVQSGPGMPSWSVGNSYRLGWSGPVMPNQQMRLVIAPSWLVRVLRVLAVLGLVWLLARVLLQLLPESGRAARRWRWAGASALLALALLPALGHAQEIPSPALLQQLQQRLWQPPECAPNCATLANAQLSVDGKQLHVLLQAQVGANVAVPLPFAGPGLDLTDVRVDGSAAAVAGDGALPLVRLQRGVHSVTLDYAIQADRISLRFARLRPKHMQASVSGWVLAGVADGRLLGDTVSLERKSTTKPGAAKVAAQAFPAYVRLTRTLRLGDDWQVSNQVQRIAPSDGGFSVSIPLLPGEHPVDEHAQVHDGRIDINFSDGQQQAQWQSSIKPFDMLTLKAPDLATRTETWRIAAASIWHVDADGVPPSPSDGVLYYQPLPGEQLKVRVARPASPGGASVAVDSVDMQTSSGERAGESMLQLRVRATRGGEQSIALPVGAKVLDVSRDGTSLALPVRDGRLSLPLLPGSHVYGIRLRTVHGVALRTSMPPLDLKAPAANIKLQLKLPHDRWVLWTWGPGDGPAVLYWSQLLLLVLVALLLSRFAPTPLRFHHWLLLGLGFSTFAWSAFALVAAWLIVLGLRLRNTAAHELKQVWFNVMQVALAALTLLALAALIGAVPRGLLGLPDMHVAGNGSTAWNLRWLADMSSGPLPHAGAFSLPLWVYKVAILAWALWLANALVGWLRWAFKAWSSGGYWRSNEATVTPADQPGKPATQPRADAAEDGA